MPVTHESSQVSSVTSGTSLWRKSAAALGVEAERQVGRRRPRARAGAAPSGSRLVVSAW